MRKEDYLESIVVKDKLVNIGIDDYGQCYYYEYVDDDGELRSVGCGTYNFDYLGCIISDLDYKSYFISTYGMDSYKEMLQNQANRWLQYYDEDATDLSWDTYMHYKQLIYDAENNDYVIYDFDKMYEERNGK